MQINIAGRHPAHHTNSSLDLVMINNELETNFNFSWQAIYKLSGNPNANW